MTIDRHQIRLPRALAALGAFAVIVAACGDDDSGGGSAASCEVGQVDGDLAIYNWAEYIDPEQLDAFAEEFGVSVTMDVYDSNEAMRTVVAAGNSGYDLVVPSSYMVEIMGESGALTELDQDAIPRQDPDEVFPHLPRDVRQHLVLVLQLDAKHRIGQWLHHRRLDLNRFFFRHEPRLRAHALRAIPSTVGPFSVTATHFSK